jgi:predicted ester cyclase
MASKVDVVRSFINASWTNPPSSIIKANQAYLADNFQSLDKDGTPVMNKEAYINLASTLTSAFGDIKWVLHGLRQDGDGVIMSGHFEGTHTGEVDLSAMGLGVIKPTGKKIVWPEALVEYKVDGDKILSERAYGGASGLDAMLAPLGIKLPTA